MYEVAGVAVSDKKGKHHEARKLRWTCIMHHFRSLGIGTALIRNSLDAAFQHTQSFVDRLLATYHTPERGVKLIRLFGASHKRRCQYRQRTSGPGVREVPREVPRYPQTVTYEEIAEPSCATM